MDIPEHPFNVMHENTRNGYVRSFLALVGYMDQAHENGNFPTFCSNKYTIIGFIKSIIKY